jgi:hypothetical protein
MTALRGFALFVLASLVHPPPAGARTFEGTLGLSIGAFGAVEFRVTGSGASGPGPLATIAAGAFVGSGAISVYTVSPLKSFVIDVSNAPGVFTGSPLGGRAPIHGAVRAIGNLGGGPITLVNVPLAVTAHGPTSAPVVTAGLGVGGSYHLNLPGGLGQYVDLSFAPWGTPRVTLSVMDISAPTRTVAYTGSDSRTPGGHGQLTLVSPIKVRTNVWGAPLSFVALGRMTLTFMPEPGTFALLGTGTGLLAALGRRRRGARAQGRCAQGP